MRASNEIQRDYTILCTELGQLVYKAANVRDDAGKMLEQMDKEIKEKQEKLSAVNKEYHAAKEAEAAEPKVVEAEVVTEEQGAVNA